MTWLGALVVLLIVGAISGPRTLLHSFAVAFDQFAQALIWDDPLGVTISSRCGLWQRRGILWPARIVNALMLSSTHCQRAIERDRARAEQAIRLLDGQ
ncbi:MAG: hypothetical protein KGL63_14850 [Betaproteobacteria bacterium]|nr:hypothetical protein [Betaproteobacteria bacterium]